MGRGKHRCSNKPACNEKVVRSNKPACKEQVASGRGKHRYINKPACKREEVRGKGKDACRWYKQKGVTMDMEGKRENSQGKGQEQTDTKTTK